MIFYNSLLYLLEPFESWESLDTEFFRDLLLLGGIDLGEEEWWIIFGKSFSSLFIFWSKLFAVTTIIVNMVRIIQKTLCF